MALSVPKRTNVDIDPMQVILRILRTGEIRRIRLSAGESTIVGRASKMNYEESIENARFDSRILSRHHGRMFRPTNGGEVWYEDLESLHGSRLNGYELPPNHPRRLMKGDTLKLGKSIIQAGHQIDPVTVHIDDFLFYPNNPPSFTDVINQNTPLKGESSTPGSNTSGGETGTQSSKGRDNIGSRDVSIARLINKEDENATYYFNHSDYNAKDDEGCDPYSPRSDNPDNSNNNLNFDADILGIIGEEAKAVDVPESTLDLLSQSSMNPPWMRSWSVDYDDKLDQMENQYFKNIIGNKSQNSKPITTSANDDSLQPKVKNETVFSFDLAKIPGQQPQNLVCESESRPAKRRAVNNEFQQAATTPAIVSQVDTSETVKAEPPIASVSTKKRKADDLSSSTPEEEATVAFGANARRVFVLKRRPIVEALKYMAVGGMLGGATIFGALVATAPNL